MLAELDARTATLTSGETAAAAEARLRSFGLGAQVLAQPRRRAHSPWLTNHPRRIVGVAGYGLEIVECLPIVVPPRKW